MKCCQHKRVEVASTLFFFLKKVMNEETETKTRKKTEHTRIVAQLCSLMNTIFTSVVVYSRTNSTNKTCKHIMWLDVKLHSLQVLVDNQWSFNC